MVLGFYSMFSGSDNSLECHKKSWNIILLLYDCVNLENAPWNRDWIFMVTHFHTAVMSLFFGKMVYGCNVYLNDLELLCYDSYTCCMVSEARKQCWYGDFIDEPDHCIPLLKLIYHFLEINDLLWWDVIFFWWNLWYWVCVLNRFWFGSWSSHDEYDELNCIWIVLLR